MMPLLLSLFGLLPLGLAQAVETPLYQTGPSEDSAFLRFFNAGEIALTVDAENGASLRLEDGVLTPVQIAPAVRYRKSGQTPPLNGCFVLLSASEPNPPSAPLAPAGTAQWIERFQAAGVGADINASGLAPSSLTAAA